MTLNLKSDLELRLSASACDGFAAEAQSQAVGRRWVRGLDDAGKACAVDYDIIAAAIGEIT